MKLFVYGAKEFAKVVNQLAGDCGFEVVGFIDDTVSKIEKAQPSAPMVMPYAYFKQQHSPSDYAVVLGVGYKDLSARHKLYLKLKKDGYKLPNLIHEKAYIHSSAKIGEGCIVMATAAVDVFTKLSDIVTLWPGSIVSHDSHVGTNTFISPGAILCGSTDIGPNCFIGAGAAVADHVTVPENSFVKAGSVFKGSNTH